LGDRIRVTRFARLPGGLSQAVYRIDLVGAEFATVVLRRWPADGDRQRQSIRREAAVLSLLDDSEVVAPQLIASDETGEWAGRPANLMTHLPGAGDLDPVDVEVWIDQLAQQLALIHAQSRHPSQERIPTWMDVDDPDRRSWLAGLPYGDEVLALATTATAPSREVFSHGDYQHFNLLWMQGQLTGVVDWAMSGVADAGRDAGHCALNLAVLHDAERAWRFLERYQAITGSMLAPSWLICELLDFSDAWPRFIPLQVDGRMAVDRVGMRGRVEELIVKVLRSAG